MITNINPNPACWRSRNHKIAINLSHVQLINCPSWEMEDTSEEALQNYDDEGFWFDVTIQTTMSDDVKMTMGARDYWSLLNAFEMYLSVR